MSKTTIPTFEGRNAKTWLRDLVLGSADESKYEAAQRAFAAMGKEVLPWLAEEFTKDALTETRAARLAQAVYAIGPQAAPLIPVLSGVIEKHPDSITHALSGLGNEAIPTFIQILRHPNQLVRMRACEKLASAVKFYGLNRHSFIELIPEILVLLQHEWHMLRWRAANLLGALCLTPDLCIPALMRCLDDPFPEVQGAAAQAVGFYGDRASMALPHLLKLSKAENVPLRSFAISALGYFSDRRVWPVLIGALRDPAVSTSAIYSLGRGQWPADILVPVLCDCIKDGDAVVRWAATEHVGRLGTQAVAAIPVLRAAMAGAHAALRELTIQALERIEGRDHAQPSAHQMAAPPRSLVIRASRRGRHQ